MLFCFPILRGLRKLNYFFFLLGECKGETLIQVGTSLLFIYNGHRVLVMARRTKRSLTWAEAAAKLKIHRGVSTYRTAAKSSCVQQVCLASNKSSVKKWSQDVASYSVWFNPTPHTSKSFCQNMCWAASQRLSLMKHLGLRVHISVPVLSRKENNSKIFTFNIGFSAFFPLPEEAGELVQ